MRFDILFQQRLFDCRKASGLSQTALGDIVGVSGAAITMMEKGRRLPSIEVLYALADYFAVSIDYLVGRSNDPTMH